MVAHWIALGLRYGHMLLPTAANPRVEAGGLCGESKTALLDQVGATARTWIAPYTTIVTDASDPATDLETADAALARAGIGFPLVAKPDIGCNGTGVRAMRRKLPEN